MAIKFDEKRKKFTDEEFYALRDFIYELSGIYFRLEKKYLIEDKIISRMEELNIQKVRDYIFYLKYSDEKEYELNLLYDFITINETSFFRYEPQIHAFKEGVLKELFLSNNNSHLKFLKIWSAGCSSGEEPYTLSIVLDELLATLNEKWSIEILATDINQKVLDKAVEGIYTEYSLRNTDPKIIESCFEKLPNNKYKIKDKYKAFVKFQKLNLLKLQNTSLPPTFDFIFCRNVLIYFDLDAKKQVVNKFYELLKPGGYLFLGHSESLHGISDSFKLILFKNALGYKKE